MISKHSVVIADPVRTAIATFGGTSKDIPATKLGATVIPGGLQRPGPRPDDIGAVVMGNAVQAGNKTNPARQAAIDAGLLVQIPSMTVNRIGGSGAQAIVSTAHEILMGSLDAAVAGGMGISTQLRIAVEPGLFGVGPRDNRLAPCQNFYSGAAMTPQGESP